MVTENDAKKYGNIFIYAWQDCDYRTRAKEVRSIAEKMITLAKKNDLASRRLVLAELLDETTVKKLFEDIAPKYEDRNGGYVRIVKIGPRRGDASPMAVLELV